MRGTLDYEADAGLDRDGDGVACEFQAALAR